ncbi:MAG: hypothetical protein LBQ98_05835 [Nitrososphaerota archaeon]|jgi:hypothetical protein|nr:hypothetical protein [Nitrososphaerota archaeon]
MTLHYLAVSIIRKNWHPNAYLKTIRNVRSGLSARTKLLMLFEREAFSAAMLVQLSCLRYNVVMYHLRLLKCEGIVERKGNRRYIWLLSGLGQKRLV